MIKLDDLARLYDTDKRTNDPGQFIYHGYTPTYEHFLESHREEYTNILELGVWRGGSHKMWKDYFPNAKIFGIDPFIEPDTKDVSDERITILKGSQDDKELIDNNFSDNQFDVIIDDGSHRSWHQQKSFLYLWSKLKNGGFYFIEDLAVCYLREFREFDDWNSSTSGWLESLRTNNPHSYYINDKDLKNILLEIGFIGMFGELAVIKRDIQ